jgi:hypothetical protein
MERYLSGVLGPMLVTAAGLGLLFLPLALVAMSWAAETDSGPPPACATPASSTCTQAARVLAAANHAGRADRVRLMAIYHHALTTGFSRAYLVVAGAMLLALALTIMAIRARRTGVGETRF